MSLSMIAQQSKPVPSQPSSRLLSHMGLAVSWADSEEEVRAAQRLRYQVFVEEMGAWLSPEAHAAGLDRDRFDDYCDHLLVRAVGASNDGMLLGTYRVLSPAAAMRAGGLYSDNEFDLTALNPLRKSAVELGRSCVHPQWRSGGVILALWTALGQYMIRHRLDTMIGCASISLQHGTKPASRIWHHLRHQYLVDPCWQVTPRCPLPQVDEEDQGEASATRFTPATPPLIKGYLRCGTLLLGPPAMDLDFNTADLPIMLRLNDLDPRYRKHFLGAH
jgi:putative hemolysin